MNKIKIKACAELGIVLGVIVGNWDEDNVDTVQAQHNFSQPILV